LGKYLRQIIAIVLFSFFAVSNLYAEDSCALPTDSIVLDNTLKNQEIDKPFIVGQPGGEALYYEIVLSVDGRLVINTATDTENASNALDTVDTHGRLLYSDCSNLDTSDIEINSNPIYFKFDKVLTAGTYYLRVHNEVTLDDSGSDLAKGFFQVENSFTPTAPTKQISITKTSATTMNSGDEIVYTINVKNEGTDATTSVQVSDPLPTPNHLTYIGVDTSTTGWSCVAGDPVVCTLDSGVINYNETKTLKLKYEADYQTSDRVVSNTTFVDVGYADASTLHEDAALRSVTILRAIPGIKITKDGPNSVIEEEEFNFRFTVENNGTKITDINTTVTGSISADFDIVDIIFDASVWKNCSYDGAKNYSCELINDLLPSASKYFDIKVKAVGDPADPEVVLHYAIVNADTVMGHVNDSDAKSVTIIAKNPVINITKVRSTGNVIVGHSAYYTIYVQNNGNIPLTNINVTDAVPAELELTSASRAGWDCTASNISTNNVDCTLSNVLDPGVTHYFYVYVKGKTVANNVNNTAFVTTAEAASDNESELINVIPPISGIRIQKSVSSSTVNSLDTFTYTLSVDNNGSETNSNIVVTDTIDARFTLPADWNSNAAPWSCSNSENDITCNYAGTLASLASTADITIKVQAPYTTTNLTIDNTAVVNADAGTPSISVTDSDTVSVNIIPPSIGFFLTKTSNKNSVVSGESYVYTIRVDNNGTLGEQDIVITDTIPLLLDGNFTVNQGNFDCSATVGRDINCQLATLSAGAHDQFTISITAPVVASSTVVVNVADATSKILIPPHVDETRTGSDSATVTINPVASSLSITKTSSQDLILENDTFDYIITVKNSSIADEHNLTVTDDIDSDFTIISHTGSGWSCSHSGQLVTCEMAILNAGVQAGDINITVQAPNTISVGKTIPNTAKVISSKEIIGKTAQKDVILVSPDNALSITMTSNPASVYTNDIYYYTVSIANNSGKDIDTVELIETLPAELQFDHSVSGGWACDYNNTSRVFSCNNNDIKFESGTKVIYLHVRAPNLETNVTNSISMTSSMDAMTRDANATTEVTGKTAKLIYTKAISDKSIVSIGEDFTYTLKIKNDGLAPESDINVTNLQIAFDLDQNVSYQSHTTTGWSCSFSAPTLTCTLPILEVGDESPDINVTVQGLSAKQAISIANLTADQVPLPQAVAISISVDVREIVDLDMSLALSDTPDPAEANSIYYYDFVIRNLDATKIAKDVILDINTTSIDDYLLISYSDTDDWDCTKVSTLLTCQLKHNLLADTNETLRLEVKAPNSVTKVELNATLSSEYVNDINLANNSAYEDTNIMITDLTSNNPREFTKVPLQGMVDMNIFGDLLTIGNQSICEKDGAGNCQEPSYLVNDFVTQEYANLDTVYAGSYKTSTSAKLEIDASDEIVWAGLYWMGRIDKTISGYQDKIDNAHRVYVRADLNTSGYVEVVAQRSTQAIDNNGATITVDKFNFINGSSYFDYQGVADITAYVKANRGDDYWVADIQSSEGDNLSAGWNMIVIVRDTKLVPTRELKNITIFDGFQGVWKTPDGITSTLYAREVNQTVKGFLTPTTGVIKSSLIFFGFEGDRTLTDFIKVSDSVGVMHSLTNVKNPSDDVVNGTITQDGVTVTSRAPNLDNTSGIDVDEFYLGDIADVIGTGIIDNGQTEANISIGSLGLASNNNGGDRFFLGMFGFSTNLNDPMCYMQTLKNADFTADLGGSVNLGETIGIEVEFHNKEIQTLTNMHGYSQIDKIFKEDNSTFELKNIAEASFTAQASLFEFGTVDTGDDNLTEVTTSIGSGATSLSGGDIQTGKSVFIRFNAIMDDISDNNLTNNVYSVSYDPNPSKKIQVSRCSGDDQTLQIIQNKTQGFELTHEGGITDGYSDGTVDGDMSNLNNESHLYTQVQDTPFTIDVVALDDNIVNRVADSYRGLVQLELVDMSDFNGSVEVCELLPSLGIKELAQFDGENRVSVDITASNAYNNVGFRLSYLVNEYNRHIWRTESSLSLAGDDNLTKVKNMLASKPYGDDERCSVECSGVDEAACLGCVYQSRAAGGLGRFSCSADRFVIKPKEISISSSSSHMLGGKDYNLTFDANASGFDHNITLGSGGTLDYNLSTPIGCDRSTLTNLTSTLMDGTIIEFKDGDAHVSNFTYENIGNINLSFVDSSWTALDQNITDAAMSDCIVGSASNTMIGGKVGCNIASSNIFSFSPARFVNDITTLNDFSNGFTYISNDKNMSAPLTFSISAMLDDNVTVATNFHKSCYATDVNYTMGVNGLSEARFFDLNSSVLDNNSSTGALTTTEGNFTNGVASIIVGLNVKRGINTPQNPFMINTGDINISVEDNGTYNVSGSGFNVAADKNVSFYYGRVNVPDIETARENIDVTFYYEIYCRDCNKTRFPLAKGVESGDSVFWYINNSSHVSAAQGTYSGERSENGITCAVNANSYTGLNGSLGTISAPHRDRVTFEPSNWLIYNKFNANAVSDSFNITFFSTSDSWAGKGDRGMIMDQNISKRNAKKMDW
jgi:uncharacterized repeat protein (TIGR01451 family)